MMAQFKSWHVYLVEAHDDVRHVDPGCRGVVHLVEQVVPEQLQHVAVTRLRPLRIQVKPEIDPYTTPYNKKS